MEVGDDPSLLIDPSTVGSTTVGAVDGDHPCQSKDSTEPELVDDIVEVFVVMHGT
jgi:hypothetical protein